MKTLLLSLCILLFCTDAWAQRNINSAVFDRCGSTFNKEQVKKKDPTSYQRWLKFEQQVEDYQRARTSNDGTGTSLRVTDPAVTVTIPVVFHVLFNTPEQNISDAQIQSQIDVLNEDFRRLNADRINTPSIFSALGADVNVEFRLACIDPNGNSTSGIIRTATARAGFDVPRNGNQIDDVAAGIKYVPGAEAWPRDRYLNVWTCNFNDINNLGYATFPWHPTPAEDGIVMGFSATGRVGTLRANFNKGRTGSHEVGHWLSLFHIWGDDGGACTGTDEVADTPNQADASAGCPSFPTISCSNTGNMSMNYMDLTDDACMNLFTNGQKDRMRALFMAGGFKESFISVKIQQASEVCEDNPVFSVAANQGAAVTYNWTVTAPLQIISGQGTNQITCSKTGQGTTTVSVSANGYCDSKSITIGAPLTPRLNASSSLNPACWNSTNVIIFSIATPQPGVSYNTEFIEVGSGQVVESIPGSRFNFRVGLLSNGTSYNVVTTATNACNNTGTIRSTRTMKTQTCSTTSTARVAMYPNPATSSVDFTAQEPTSPETETVAPSTTAPAPIGFQVSVYDSNGQMRWQSETRTRLLHFDSSRLPRGLYRVIITESSTVTHQNLSLE
jgi:hypothetical protein